MLKRMIERKKNRMKSNTRKLVLLLVAAVAAGWWMLGTDSKEKKPENTANVTAVPVLVQDVPIQVKLVGTVVAYETVAVKSRLDSQVVNVLFRDGDFVKEGQVLFELDDRAIKAEIEQFKASLVKEKAQLVNSDLQYQRALKLIKTNVVAQAQVDEAKAGYEAQQAQVNAAQANLDNAGVQLSYTQIRAPISGRTGTINVTRGNNVKANDTQPLVTINQISPIRVQFAIAQRYYEQVKTALQSDRVNVIAQNKDSTTEVRGNLEYVDNAIDVSNGTFSTRAVFGNEDEKLWPGMFVNITMDLGLEKNALTIPSVAVQGDEGKHYVFAVSDEGNGPKAVRKFVDVSTNNGDIAVIKSGLADTDKVIVDGILRLTDGAPITVTVPASTQAGASGTPAAPERSPDKSPDKLVDKSVVAEDNHKNTRP
jgi:membrane fusion protein, multidrug efflux system